MSSVPAASSPVSAILVSDLHLSHKPPLARSCEEDWYGVMEVSLKQLRETQVLHGCPVLCSGDVFDKWNSPSELVNFALVHLPVLYAVPGNHDLPHHQYQDIKKSSFYTLVEARTIILLEPEQPLTVEKYRLRLWGFPCGFDPKPAKNPHDLVLEIALVHKFFYTKNTGYPGAPEENRSFAYQEKLQGYDVALFGDNHKPCQARVGNCLAFNPGGFFRRNADQIEYKPSVGLLHEDGTITRHYLDCSQDRFMEPEMLKGLTQTEGLEELLAEMLDVQDTVLDFEEACHRFFLRGPVTENVKKIILQALEKT